MPISLLVRAPVLAWITFQKVDPPDTVLRLEEKRIILERKLRVGLKKRLCFTCLSRRKAKEKNSKIGIDAIPIKEFAKGLLLGFRQLWIGRSCEKVISDFLVLFASWTKWGVTRKKFLPIEGKSICA